MKQEDYNSMMRYPWESDYKKETTKLPLCPECGEEYCGDGVKPCIDCEATLNEEEINMRDIKFRFYSKASERYVSDNNNYAVCGNGDIYHLPDAYHDNFEPVSRNYVIKEQYIGLSDIDSIELFQGDICEVMYYTPFGDKTDDFYGKWVVEKWTGQFILTSGKERITFTDLANKTSSEYVAGLGNVYELSETVNVRVIGNIHQNPELIGN